MKKIISLILLSIICISCFSSKQNTMRETKSESELLNDNKDTIEKIIHLSNGGYIAEKVPRDLNKLERTEKSFKYDAHGILKYYEINKFGSSGHIIEKSRYNPDKSLIYKEIWKYNKRRQLTENEVYDSDGSVKNKKTYRYDENGDLKENLTSDFRENIIRKTTIKNTEDLKIVEKIISNTDGQLQHKEITKYDKKGNKIEEVFYRDWGLSHIITLKHTDNGKEIKQINYKTNGEIKQKKIEKYNKKGKPLEESIYNADDTLSYKETRKYDTDDKSLIEIAEYYTNGNIKNKRSFKKENEWKVTKETEYTLSGEIEGINVYKYSIEEPKNEIYQYNSDEILIYKKTSQKNKEDGQNDIEEFWYNPDGSVKEKKSYKKSSTVI